MKPLQAFVATSGVLFISLFGRIVLAIREYLKSHGDWYNSLRKLICSSPRRVKLMLLTKTKMSS